MILLRPRRIDRTGDDSPAVSLARYIWRMTGWHQVGICLLAVAVSMLNLVPIDLQRRIIDGPITERNLDGLLGLALVYLGVVLVHRAAKFALAMLQGWLSESVVLYTRSHLSELYFRRGTDTRKPGEAASVINAEVDNLGGFAGQAPSQAIANIVILAGVIVYMLWVSPQIAVLALVLLVPQVALTPVIQRRLNRLVETRLTMLREMSEDLQAEIDTPDQMRLRDIYRNRMRYRFWKFLMKALLNTLNLLAPLGVLAWGGYLAIEGATTVGVLVAFVSGFDRISAPVRELLTFYRGWAQARVQHDAIAEWIETGRAG